MQGKRVRGILILAATLLVIPACIVAQEPVSEIDLPVPGELAVVRDADEPGLYLIRADGSEARRIVDDGAYYGSAWSPDGTQIAATMSTSHGQPLFIIDVESESVTTVEAPRGSYESPTWSPDGRKLAFSGIDLGREPVYPTPRASSGIPAPGIMRPNIFVANADGSNVQPLFDNLAEQYALPLWSPDGAHIAFIGPEAQLWIMDADGSNPMQVSQGMQSVFNPVWSPDGRKLAFVGYPNEYPGVYVVNVDGSSQQRVVPDDFRATNPDWSPDGSELAIVHYAGQSTELYVLNVATDDMREVTSVRAAGGVYPAWSPDGEWIAFTAAMGEGENTSDPTYLSIVNAHDDDAEAQTIVRDVIGPWRPAWRPSID